MTEDERIDEITNRIKQVINEEIEKIDGDAEIFFKCIGFTCYSLTLTFVDTIIRDDFIEKKLELVDDMCENMKKMLLDRYKEKSN